MRDFAAAVQGTLLALVAWAVASAIWNFAGVWLVAHGQRALGPTASVEGGLALLAIIAALVVSAKRWPLVHVLLAVACGLLAFLAVAGAFVQDPALWPSEFWRYAGAAINAFGVAAAIAAVVAYFRWKRAG
jgi:predicted ferric reductase